jgi:SAM-dependent methyltransferase
MNTNATSTADGNPLFELQQTLYASGNYTRRRLHRARLHWVTSAITRHATVVPVWRAVEYGPGSGIYLPVLSRHCGEVVAADVEPAYLAGIRQLAGEIGGLKLVVDDIQESRFKDDSFGLALCSEVLEHVPDPERSLQTLYRIVQPGGIAIVTTPQRYSLMELCCKIGLLPGVIDVVRMIYREPVLPTGHISLRTCGAFSAAIRQCGWQIVEHQKFGLYVPVLTEFGGVWGGRLIESLEQRLADTIVNRLFWTQAWVLRKPAA